MKSGVFIQKQSHWSSRGHPFLAPTVFKKSRGGHMPEVLFHKKFPIPLLSNKKKLSKSIETGGFYAKSKPGNTHLITL